ncbi:MAG TPA: xanthine dehydrogenase family protein subunit M [Pyrinomonadaceae bacterium]|nr:xanthine dehydrogenase family protein subunit M [Pyrinomonadaceae bacterium]
MRPFKYTRAADVASAIKAASANKDAKFIAGGSNIIDLMREGVLKPSELVDIAGLNLTQVKALNGGVSIGALAKNTDTANHPLIRQGYPLLTQAILSGASAQIRNMATNGGNLMQQTRCSYFYDIAMPCNKREMGSGCAAVDGINRNHAIFGWNANCVDVHPSDMCVALAALDATVNVQGPDGKTRAIAFPDFYQPAADMSMSDTSLKQGELITSIDLPKSNFANNSYYLKVRDRASFAFALVSVAAALEISGGKIKQVRLAMGGVAPKPWRALNAEKVLIGKAPDDDIYRAAAEAEMKDAKPLAHNKFKVELGKRAIVLALKRATRKA